MPPCPSKPSTSYALPRFSTTVSSTGEASPFCSAVSTSTGLSHMHRLSKDRYRVTLLRALSEMGLPQVEQMRSTGACSRGFNSAHIGFTLRRLDYAPRRSMLCGLILCLGVDLPLPDWAGQ